MSVAQDQGGKIESKHNALSYLDGEDQNLESIEAAQDILAGTDNSDITVEGAVEAGESRDGGGLMDKTENTHLEADKFSTKRWAGTALKDAKQSSVKSRRGHVSHWAVSGSRDSYIIADHLRVGGIGNTLGSVVAAKNLRSSLLNTDLNEDFIRQSNTVFTQEEIPRTVRFTGDWDKLTEMVEERTFDGYFEPLEVFSLGDRISSVNSIENRMENLHSMYEKISKATEIYRRFGEENELTLTGSNAERFRDLKEVENRTGPEVERALSNYDILDQNIGLETEGDFEGIVDDLEQLGEMIDDEIVETANQYGSVKYTLGLNLEGSNEEKIQDLGRLSDLLDNKTVEKTEKYREIKNNLGLELEGSNKSRLEEFSEFQDLIDDDLLEFRDIYRDIKTDLDLELEGDNKERLEEIRKLEEKVDEDTLEQIERYNELNKEIGIELEGSNLEKIDSLENLDQEIEDHLRTEFSVREDNIDYILDSRHDMYLLKHLDKIEEIYDSVDDFIDRYSTDPPEEAVLNTDFTKEIFVSEDNFSTEVDDLADESYQKGLDILGKIAREGGRFDLDKEQKDRELIEVEEELQKVRKELSNAEGFPGEDLIQKKERLERERDYKQREIAFTSLGLNYDIEPHEMQDLKAQDLGDGSLPSRSKVETALSQIAQEFLEGEVKDEEYEGGSVAEDAYNTADDIDVNYEGGEGMMEVEVWDKSIENMPSVDGLPCILPGGVNEAGALYHIRDPGTQFLPYTINDDSGIIMTNPVEFEGDDFLFIHSVESEDDITRSHNHSEALQEVIEDYARDSGMEGVIYYDDPQNQGPNYFLETLESLEEDYETNEITVEASDLTEDRYLDLQFPDVGGFVKEF